MGRMTIINNLFVAVVLLAIAGGIVGVVFLMTQRLIYKFTTAHFLININKIAILAFVIPFFWILGEMDHSNQTFLEYDSVVLVQENSIKAFLYEIRESGNLANVISVIWLIGLILYLLLQAAIYYYFTQSVRDKRLKMKDGLWFSTFQACAAEMNMECSKIGVYSVPNIFQPCTVGVWKKSILIPEYLLEKVNVHEIHIILSHELTHIRKNHVALKVLTFLLSSLNWFNPVLHILKNSLYEWIEISCDENLTLTANTKDREIYANVLVKLSENTTEQQRYGKVSAITYFGTEKSLKLLKKRIIGIMKKEQKMDRLAKGITIAGAICAVVCGTAFTKEMDFAINSVFSNHVAVFKETEIMVEENVEVEEEYVYTDFDEKLFEKQPKEAFDPSVSYEVIYMDGSIQLLMEDFSEEECTHSLEKVNVAEHTKNADESCVLLMYEGMHCKECENTVLGGIIYTTSSAVCIH